MTSKNIFSRSEWTIRLLRLPRIEQPTDEPGLVMVQIDGLSMTQFNRALRKKNLPFLQGLLAQQQYILRSFYSGLPSNTPAVQAEIFYGVKGAVAAFAFVDKESGQPVKMMDVGFVKQFEKRLEAQNEGLLTGGSAYSDIYTGGARESHFCFSRLGLEGIWHAINPLVFPFLVILYIDVFLRTMVLIVVEFFLAVFECMRGTLKGRLFFRELELVWQRALVCIFLREFITAGACIDIRRGLKTVHLNFLGYDEQAHGRGPSSAFAHWSLQGIDDAIKRVYQACRRSQVKSYSLWVYSDHGQVKTTPYLVKYGRTVEEAVQELFGQDNLVITAMGPLGHIYAKLLKPDQISDYAQKLVTQLNIPLVLTTEGERVRAWTSLGCFAFPREADKVFGRDHPFLEEIKEDLVRVCLHPDAGEFVIAGWAKGSPAISFPLEYGAHASMGIEETHAFTLLPADVPVPIDHSKNYLRPVDLRGAAQAFLSKKPPALPKRLTLMTYNVHGCCGMDGFISTERIAKIIERYNPDIIALQELDVGRSRSGKEDQAEGIARKLAMECHFHPAFRWQDEQYGNAILSRYPMALIKSGPLPQWKDKRRPTEPRGALWVTVDLESQKVHIFNTHLSLWPRERSLQAEALLSEQWTGHPDCQGPLVVCGDFNALPRSTVYRKLCGRLRDSQRCLAGHRPQSTWSGRYPISRLDYIFISEDLQVRAIRVPRSQLEKTASDHLPLIAQLQLV